MESHQILYVAIARTRNQKILFSYLPNKKEKKSLELVRKMFVSNLVQQWFKRIAAN